MATAAGDGLRVADVVDLCVRVMPHAVVVVVGPAHSSFYIVDKSFKVSTAGGMRRGECVADPTALVNARGKGGGESAVVAWCRQERVMRRQRCQ